MNCDLSPLSATNSAKQLERSKKMENAEQEFVSVVREYERVIYKVCYLYTTPNATLNDLYQEVVLNLWKAFPKFRRECKISTWIYRIALNTCISFIRKEKNIPEIVTLNQEADRTEETDETQAMLRQLYRMINRLGQLEKSIILLYLEEKSYEEIAEITGLTLTNVATKLSRIKDKLKKMNKYMELDELKKSWNALNEQLQKEPIADEQQITELIAGYKANTRKSLGRLVVIQRFSIGIGTICLATLLLIWLLLPTFGFNEQLQEKIVPFLGFIAISILAGMWWDWKTYRWNKNTHIEEMSVAEVSRRMTTFRQWTKYEVMGISIWIILFNILNYWVMEYHLMSVGVQAILITLFVVFDALIIYILYKKVIYKHLDNIKKNIEELKDICTE